MVESAESNADRKKKRKVNAKTLDANAARGYLRKHHALKLPSVKGNASKRRRNVLAYIRKDKAAVEPRNVAAVQRVL